MADPTPPHVLFVSSVGTIGGAERVLLASVRAVREGSPRTRRSALLLGDGPLRAALEASDTAVMVAALPPRLASWGEGGARAPATPLRRLRSAFGQLRRLMAASRFLRAHGRLLAAARPTLIHAHGIKALLLTAPVVPKGASLVWHVHDFLPSRPFTLRWLRRIAPRITHAIAVSRAVADDLARELPDLPVTVVHNGVDLAHFAPAPRDGAGLDRLAGLASDAGDCVRIGLVATYAEWKGHETFLRALAACRSNVRGYVVGGPIYATEGSEVTREALCATVQACGLVDRVAFVPFQADPVEAYRMLDVVVHASTRPEPFGLTIAEAMACGRAVVVAAAGGALELYEEGRTALGHEPGDAAALAAAIDRLARDAELRAQLGGAGREAMVARFGHERFARELLALYARVTHDEVLS